MKPPRVFTLLMFVMGCSHRLEARPEGSATTPSSFVEEGQWVYTDLLDPEMSDWEISIVKKETKTGQGIRANYRMGELGGYFSVCEPDSGYWCLVFGDPIAATFFAMPLAPVSNGDSWVYGEMTFQMVRGPSTVNFFGNAVEVSVVEASESGEPKSRFWFSSSRGVIAFQYLRKGELVPEMHVPTSFYVLNEPCGLAASVACEEDLK